MEKKYSEKRKISQVNKTLRTEMMFKFEKCHNVKQNLNFKRHIPQRESAREKSI